MRRADIKVEPYWNVKNSHLHMLQSNCLIKVEPYWNVKVHERFHGIQYYLIKVEPYWNVKDNSLKKERTALD